MFPFVSHAEARLGEIDRLLPTPDLMDEVMGIVFEADLAERGAPMDFFG